MQKCTTQNFFPCAYILNNGKPPTRNVAKTWSVNHPLFPMLLHSDKTRRETEEEGGLDHVSHRTERGKKTLPPRLKRS